MKHLIYSVVMSFFLILVSCAENKTVDVKDANTFSICELEYNISPVGSLFSFDIVNDSTFVLTDNNRVILYDFSGKQIREIGHSGRAEFEYNMPMIVKAFNDVIYVWSAMTLKFIAYALDGTPIAEYEYKSAISDFLPTDEYLFVYTAGLSFDHIIDVYELSSEKVIRSIGQSTQEHKLMLHNMSVAPFAYSDGSLYFTSKDKLDVMKYDIVSDELSIVNHIKSSTFEPDQLSSDYSSIARDRNKRRQYFWSNPMAILLNPHPDGIDVLTLEGNAEMQDNVVNSDKRYVGFYTSDNVSRPSVSYYSYSSFNTQSLFDTYDGEIYYILHSVDGDDDVYRLKKLI